MAPSLTVGFPPLSLLWFHKDRIIDRDVLFHFRELDEEMSVLNMMNYEWNLDAVDFTIIVELSCAGDLVGGLT
jgi:hypothetical protein